MDPISTLVTGPGALPVSLADVKDYCRVDHDEEDNLLQALLDASVAHVQARVGKVLINQTWRADWDGRVSSFRRYLPVVPVSSITEIAYTDRDGADQTATIGDFHLVASEDEAWLEPKRGKVWPALDASPSALRITYVAGFGGEAAVVPANLALAIKQIVAYWYEYREAVVVSGQPMELPLSAQVLINQSRIGWMGA